MYGLRSRLLALAVVIMLTMSACLPRESVPPGALTVRDRAAALSLADAAVGPQIKAKLGQMPLYFVENRGQLDPQVGYYAQVHGSTTFFTSGGLTFSLVPGQQRRARDGSD